MKLNFKNLSVSVLSLWLIVFALIPLLLVLGISFLHASDDHVFQLPFTLNNYQLLANWLYLKVFLRSLKLALLTTLICLAIAYPFTFIVAKINPTWRSLLLILLIIPFWTSSLLRSYAIVIMLKSKGIINFVLLKLGIIHTPLHMLYTNTAVLIGLSYSLLPYMILPLYANIEKLDWRLLDAARDLGASRFTAFYKVILPLSLPGIVSGSLLTLLPAMTMFYIPDLLGGAKSLLLGNLIQTQFLEAHNWPLGSAISILLSVFMLFLLLIFWQPLQQERQQTHASS